MSINDIGLEPLYPFFQDWEQVDPSIVTILADILFDAEKRLKTRGPGFLTISLPELGKLFDQGLSTGRFSWDLIPSDLGKLKSGSPYSRLMLRFFSSSGISYDNDPDHVFFCRTFLYMYKKIRAELPEDVTMKALKTFIETDESLPYPILDWYGSSLFKENKHVRKCIERSMERRLIALPSVLVQILDQVTSRIASQFEEVIPGTLSPSHGTGAVAEGTKFRDKYHFTSWGTKLNKVFPYPDFALPNKRMLEDWECMEEFSNTEPPLSRLCGVPKTMKGPRLITIEPTSHVYCQKAVLEYMRLNLPEPVGAFYNPYSQVPSQDLCRLGSINGDYVTVDLSEASDRLTCAHVEYAFRSNISMLNMLHACRSPDVYVSELDTVVKLKKYAGMGNATTFPVQTVFYGMLCIAAILFEKNWKVKDRNILRAAHQIQIFGDDIIIPKFVYKTLSILLSEIGLKINKSKTHTEGYFREACGLDAFMGHDVTPLYISRSKPPLDSDIEKEPELLFSWVEISNNAYKKGLWNLSAWMDNSISRKFMRLIPIHHSEEWPLRLYSFQTSDIPHGVKGKYCPKFQRTRYKTLALKSSLKWVERGSSQSLLQYFVEVPPREEKPLDHLRDRSVFRSGWAKRQGARLCTLRV